MYKPKKLLRLALPACALLGALLISLALHKATARPQSFLNTSSPKAAYTVHLTGRKDRPRFPAIYHEVRFDVWKNATAFLSDKYLHSGDWFDPSFETLYPHHAWVDHNVLRFYREDYFSKGTPDTLIVVNSTDETVKYLRVTSDSMFLLFDVQPKSTTELSMPAPRGDLKWVSAEGEYSDGQSIEKDGVDFVIRKESRSPFTYYINITGDGLIINSPQLEKYKRGK